MTRAPSPRAILLDVVMPEMYGDGWSVLAALKAAPETVGIPVVMASFVVDAALSASLGAADLSARWMDTTVIYLHSLGSYPRSYPW
ncbi:putative two-component system response regulator [Methylobacterium pseudosasicola]|uniref:Putative two-component system response regulator n=2 Tax=Methylobacterium pseudosasicola TaxID=582667 RepID=A0A1I4UDC0_9HYPH|nr:putative two-component system response regulator [Methylobacterium pseudosasicola]